MPFEIMEAGGKPVKMWLPEGHEIEVEARLQLGRVSRLPIVTNVACMPDVHVGRGATIGSVIGTDQAIIPAAVGVDIGCGMMAQKLSVQGDLPDSLRKVREAIELAVPHGRTHDGQAGDRGAWGDPPNLVGNTWRDQLSPRYREIVDKHPKMFHKFAVHHLGTLGTGNHFIELCLDEDNCPWIMLHSGSRGVGNKVGSYFIRKAKEDMQAHGISVEDRDLSYLSEGSENFNDYVLAVEWAQDYAWHNRQIMMVRILGALRGLVQKQEFPPFQTAELAVNCHHNYVEKERHGDRSIWVTRKGAVRAQAHDLGIIPGSMGAKSFIVRGKGNPESLHSCSHGAGRVMSRTKARETFSVEDHVLATEGVECRKDEAVVDETPMAYKDIDAVMAAQSDLVGVVHTLKQIVCVKG